MDVRTNRSCIYTRKHRDLMVQYNPEGTSGIGEYEIIQVLPLEHVSSNSREQKHAESVQVRVTVILCLMLRNIVADRFMQTY